MKRIAILIGSGRSKHGNLPGVEIDLAQYHGFLRTPQGGAWNTNEIVCLRNPSEWELYSALATSHGAEFSLVLYSGHGSVDARLTMTLSLNDDFEAPVNRLATQARKQLCIVDACRSFSFSPEPPGIISGIDTGAVENPVYRASCRAVYENAIEQAGDGSMVLYSCSIGQSSLDTRRGGLFSRTLLDTCTEWGASAGSLREMGYAAGPLDVRAAFRRTSTVVTTLNSEQRPQMRFSKPDGFAFPIAVR